MQTMAENSEGMPDTFQEVGANEESFIFDDFIQFIQILWVFSKISPFSQNGCNFSPYHLHLLCLSPKKTLMFKVKCRQWQRIQKQCLIPSRKWGQMRKVLSSMILFNLFKFYRVFQKFHLSIRMVVIFLHTTCIFYVLHHKNP